MSKDSKVDLKKIAEELVNLSVLQVNELNQILKDEYGLEPAAAAVAVAPTAGKDAEGGGDEGGKSQYDILLKEAGEQKVAVIKAIKDLTEMPLGEAKTLVESAPKNVREAVEKEEAEKIKAKLEEVGATVELV